MATTTFARMRWHPLAATALVLASPGRARGAEPGLTTVDRHTQSAAQAPESPPVASTTPTPGSTQVFAAFRYHADSLRSQRIAASASAMIFGAAMVGTGIYVEKQWNEDFGTVLWIAGAVGVAGGGLTLLLRTEVENLADEHGVYLTRAPTAEQEAALERDWEKAAASSRLARQIGGGIGLGLSAVGIGATVVVAASDGIEDETKHWLVPTLALSAAALGSSGALALILESPTESAYGAYRATRPSPPKPAFRLTNVRIGAAPLPNGGWVGVSAAF